ncbi:hypothetical protein Bca4012_065913 [Brassica carinata]
MFPQWDSDVEDPAAENIIKVTFNQRPWKSTMDFWEVTGTWVKSLPAVLSPAKKEIVVVKEDSPRPRKKARKEATIVPPTEALAEAHEEASEEVPTKATTTVALRLNRRTNPGVKVLMGRTREGRACRRNKLLKCPEMLVPRKSDVQQGEDRYQQKRKAALAACNARSERTRRLSASQQSPYAANSTAKVIIPNNPKLFPGYNPFAPIDKRKLKELAEWLKTDPHYRTPLDKKPRKSPTWWYNTLWTSVSWLEDCHMDARINVLRKRYDARPHHFRSERLCFLDHLFSQQWRTNYKDFKSSETDHNGLGRRLPGGAWNYYSGTIPSFFQSKKCWGADIDDIYAPVNYKDVHWIAMMISISKRHIIVWDRISTSISQEQLYERQTDIPQACSGDCGVYALKYIECHALGMTFNKKDFAKDNGKSIRYRMAVDIFNKLPDQHMKDNEDNDENLETYEG